MRINPDQEKPIFIQIAEGIEDGILTGAFPGRISDSFHH